MISGTFCAHVEILRTSPIRGRFARSLTTVVLERTGSDMTATLCTGRFHATAPSGTRCYYGPTTALIEDRMGAVYQWLGLGDSARSACGSFRQGCIKVLDDHQCTGKPGNPPSSSHRPGQGSMCPGGAKQRDLAARQCLDEPARVWVRGPDSTPRNPLGSTHVWCPLYLTVHGNHPRQG